MADTYIIHNNDVIDHFARRFNQVNTIGYGRIGMWRFHRNAKCVHVGTYILYTWELEHTAKIVKKT